MMNKRNLLRRGSEALLLALTLAACGGGGGGGAPVGGGITITCADTEYDPIVTAGANTYCNYGLPMIDAAAAYAKGGDGTGVLVAVIDTGIEPTHSELDANISPDSIDIVRGDPMTDISGHGTHVAGIIAAEQNGVATHGVAYNATILAIRADTESNDGSVCSPDPPPCSIGFTDADITSALNYAATKFANVINMSLGGPAPLSAAAQQALIDAMAAGAIIVVATGNEAALQPSWPARYARDTDIGEVNESGQMIAVGAVDSTGLIASFSNGCGGARHYCLVAPGVNITSDYLGDGFAIGSGTSQAAPYVSGAAALLIQLFPALTAAEVVQILLVSAIDLGDPGVDRIYGHGLLSLTQAVQPLGTLRVPLAGSAAGDSVDVAVTVLSLGPAFGDALSGNALLDRAFALDDFDRPYVAGLGSGVVHAGRGFGLEALRMAADVEAVEATLPGGLSLAMAVSDAGEPASLAHPWPADGDANAPTLHGLSLSGADSEGTAFRLGYDVAAAQQFAGTDDATSAGLYWMAADMLNPHYGLVGIGNGVTLVRAFGGTTTATLGWVDQTDRSVGGGDARIGELAISRRFGGGASLRAGLALIDEADGFLGSEAAGAFAVAGASSRIYTAGGAMPLGGGVEMIGSYTVVDATMEADGTSLLGDWGAVRADAFGLAVARRGVFGAGDRIGLLVGQPLRVNAATATLTAPVDYTLDKTVIRESERVSLVPTGREIDLQIAYDAELAGDSRVSSWVMMQLEPGHVENADPAYGVGLRFDTRF